MLYFACIFLKKGTKSIEVTGCVGPGLIAHMFSLCLTIKETLKRKEHKKGKKDKSELEGGYPCGGASVLDETSVQVFVAHRHNVVGACLVLAKVELDQVLI